MIFVCVLELQCIRPHVTAPLVPIGNRCINAAKNGFVYARIAVHS